MPILFLSVFLALSVWGASIPIIGRTHKSTYFAGEISSDEYQQTLTTLTKGIGSELIDKAPVTNSHHWKLQKISVGLGLSGEIGVGPLKYGTSLRHRLVYARSK